MNSKYTRREGLKIMGATAVATAIAPLAARADGHTVHEVQMLNKHPEENERQVFFPAVVRAQPGDTIKFVATDKGHNSASTKDMIPDGAEAWKGKINEDLEVTLDVEGAYAFNCTPHRTAGMVGLILVGNVDNLDALKEVRQRGKAKQRFEAYFAEADEILASESS